MEQKSPQLPLASLSWDGLEPAVREEWHSLIVGVNLPPLVELVPADELDEEEFDASRLAELINQDPVLAAKIMAVANSALYGTSAPVKTVQRAIVHLGLQLVRMMILTYQLETAFASMPFFPARLLKLVSHLSQGTAAIAFRIAEFGHTIDPSEAATTGLVARVGNLVVGLGTPRPGLAYYEESSEYRILSQESELWRVTNSALAGHLLRHWGLPDSVPDRAERIWEPLFREIEDNRENRVVCNLCLAGVLARYAAVNPCQPVAEVLKRDELAVLRENVSRCALLEPLKAALTSPAVRRAIGQLALKD